MSFASPVHPRPQVDLIYTMAKFILLLEDIIDPNYHVLSLKRVRFEQKWNILPAYLCRSFAKIHQPFIESSKSFTRQPALLSCQMLRCVLHSLVPQVQTFTVRGCHATSTESKRPHILSIPIVRKKIPSRQLFPQDLQLWVRIPSPDLSQRIAADSSFLIIFISYHFPIPDCQNLSKETWNFWRISLEAKWRLINCYVSPALLYGREFWTIP